MTPREKTLLVLLFGAGALALASLTPSGKALVTSAENAIGGAFVNRGLRANNPGNIRRSNIVWRNSYQSQAECEAAGRVWDTDFVVFFTIPDGERALGHQIATDLARGQNTVRLIVAGDPTMQLYGYAPASENDTETYITNVCNALGVTDSDVLDDSLRPQIAQAIMTEETGYKEDFSVLTQAVYS